MATNNHIQFCLCCWDFLDCEPCLTIVPDMSNDGQNAVKITGENTCVVLWFAQAVILRGYQAVVDKEHHHLVHKFFGNATSILCRDLSAQRHQGGHNHILVMTKTDRHEPIAHKNNRLVVAGIGFNPEELNALAIKYNPHRTLGADIVFGPGCHGLPNSGLTKSITAAFNGKAYRLPYTGQRCYAYVEDFALAAVDALSTPSQTNFSPVQIGERAEVEELLRDLEYVFPYNGISALGPQLTDIFNDPRLLPHSLIRGMENSRAVLKRMSTG